MLLMLVDGEGLISMDIETACIYLCKVLGTEQYEFCVC
jgi:hypothetical protein